jgi:hypothetical protein
MVHHILFIYKSSIKKLIIKLIGLFTANINLMFSSPLDHDNTTITIEEVLGAHEAAMELHFEHPPPYISDLFIR